MLEALLGGEIRPPQKLLPRIAQLFYGFCFGRLDPQGREIAKYWGLGHFGLGQPLALGEILGEKRKNTITGFNWCVSKKIETHAPFSSVLIPSLD